MKRPYLLHPGTTACLIGSLLLSGCNSNNDSGVVQAASTPTRTVLVYMVGSDLESQHNAASKDIAEMMQVGSGEKLNIVITTGGANKPGWKTVQRKLVKKGSVQTLADLGNLNMGQESSLRDFLDWGMRSYPADKYTLVFWNHGAGAVGSNGSTVGNDENHGNDALSLPEIAQALNTVTRVNGKRFDLIGFDTCLMATVETASIVSPFADYMVASEELEPGNGWDYKAWLGAAKAQPTISTFNLGKTIVDSYFASYPAGSDDSKSLTLSAVQLSKVAALNTELGKLARKMGDRLTASPDTARIEIAGSRGRAEKYGQSGGDSGMVDLKDFLDHLPASLTTEANRVRTALTEAVAYNRKASGRPKATGLSIYLPGERTIAGGIADDISAYKQIGYNSFWSNVLDRYSVIAANDKTAPGFAAATATGSEISAQILDTPDLGDVEVYVTDRLDAEHLLVVSREEPDSFTGGIAKYEFNGLVIHMNDTFVFTEVLDEDEDNGRYLLGIPALVDGRQGQVLVLAMVDDDSISLDAIGFQPESEPGLAARMMPINPGEVIQPLYQRLNVNTGAVDYVTMDGNRFTVGAGGISVDLGTLPAGTYTAFFTAEDFSGNRSYSDSFDLSLGGS